VLLEVFLLWQPVTHGQKHTSFLLVVQVCDWNNAQLDGVRLIENSATSGVDYAENYPADPKNVPQPGDVVSIVAQDLQVLSQSQPNQWIRLLSVLFQPIRDMFLMMEIHLSRKYQSVLMDGVPVNVSTINGAIYVGDYLTSSNIPGVAMKVTGAGQVIGTGNGR